MHHLCKDQKLIAMKHRYLKLLLLLLSYNLLSTSVFAQFMPPDLFDLQVFPSQPTTADSVYVSLTYTSNDGCPDYYLSKDSVESFMVLLSVRKINNSTRACTQAFTKFVTRMNLGVLGENTQIYVDGKLIQTVKPSCKFDRKGVVVVGTGDCAYRYFIKEHTITLSAMPMLYTLNRVVAKNADGSVFTGFRPGDEVRFGAILTTPDSTIRTCHIAGDAICCEITSSYGDCKLNKKGIVVAGIDGCTGQWFVKDLSPVFSYPRLYQFENYEKLKAGTNLTFGVWDIPRDSSSSILCPTFGKVRCYIHAAPILPDTLAGMAYTGDSVVKAGTAILFQKGYRKAMRSSMLKNGRFEFTNIPPADYTVYVIPDRALRSDYLPTFYVNKLAYKNADYYKLLDGMNEVAVNLRKYEKRTGKGRIYGNVYFETANLKDSILNYYGEKDYLYTADSKTAINVPVILFNLQGTAIDWTMSDESGNYVFENVALDSYRIVTETGESQAESNVILSQDNSVVGADMMLKAETIIDALPTVTKEAINMYPNPVSDILHLEAAKVDLLRIYNSLGQLILERELSIGTNVLNVHHLKQGIYLAKLGTLTQKLIRK